MAERTTTIHKRPMAPRKVLVTLPQVMTIHGYVEDADHRRVYFEPRPARVAMGKFIMDVGILCSFAELLAVQDAARA